jgi:hypothetical protein
VNAPSPLPNSFDVMRVLSAASLGDVQFFPTFTQSVAMRAPSPSACCIPAFA